MTVAQLRPAALMQSVIPILLAGVCALCVSPQAAAQCDLETYGASSTQYLPVNATPHPYTGDQSLPQTKAHCKQHYRLYLPPTGKKPAAGWPVLVHINHSGFTKSDDPLILDTANPGRFELHMATALENGIAVVAATCTLSTLPGTGDWAACDASTLAGQMNGAGLFHPPGTNIGGLRPYEDLTYDMAEKDAVMLIQHVRHHGGEQGHLLEPVDRTRLAVAGTSAAAVALMWPAFGPDRRELFANQADPAYQKGQFLEPTRADAAIFTGGITLWPIFLTTELGLHFGRSGSLDVAADKLGEVPLGIQMANSAVVYQDSAANDSLPTYMLHDENYCQAIPGPGQQPQRFTESNIHTSWSGLYWKMLHPTSTRLALGCTLARCDNYNCPGEATCQQTPCGDDRAFQKALAAGLVTPADYVPTQDDQIVDMVCWLKTNLVDKQPKNAYTAPWSSIDVGSAGPGRPVPEIVASGTLEPGTKIRLHVEGAPPFALAQLRLVPLQGAKAVNMAGCAPILEPRFTRLLYTDGEGMLTDELPVDQMPSDKLLFQVLMLDPQAPCGFSTTDVVKAIAP